MAMQHSPIATPLPMIDGNDPKDVREWVDALAAAGMAAYTIADLHPEPRALWSPAMATKYGVLPWDVGAFRVGELAALLSGK